MEREIKSAVRTLVSLYRRRTGLSLATLSKKIYGHSGFLKDFFAGYRSIKIDNLDQVLIKLHEIWPPGLPWPLFEVNVRPPGQPKRRKRVKVSPKIYTVGTDDKPRVV